MRDVAEPFERDQFSTRPNGFVELHVRKGFIFPAGVNSKTGLRQNFNFVPGVYYVFDEDTKFIPISGWQGQVFGQETGTKRIRLQRFEHSTIEQTR